MVFLLVVLLASAAWGYAAGIVGAIVADVLLNLFFIPPVHEATVQDPRNVVALAVFLAVAVVGAWMLALFRRQLAAATARRAELLVMLDLSRHLAAAPSPRAALDALTSSVARTLGARYCAVLQHRGDEWETVSATTSPAPLTRDEAVLAERAIASGRVTRRLSERAGSLRLLRGAHPKVRDMFVPIRSGERGPGVLHVAGEAVVPEGWDLDALLQGFANETGSALEQIHLAEEAQRADAIQRADEFKTTLLSSVSHDLKSPLTAIKAAVGSLRTPGVAWSDADREQFLATIESQTDRLTDTVTDLLDMSRLEAGSVQVRLEPVEIRPLLQDVALATASVTGGRTVSVNASPGLWARANHALLLHALTNLVENAAKYSKPGAPISVSGDRESGRVVISVADAGPGIPAAELPFVFERFYRGTSARQVLGTGLGLSIVKSMVELNRGRITVESSPAGTAFRISLPPESEPS